MSHSDDEEFQAKDEDEVSIPRACLNKFIKDTVPDARLTTETRDLLLSCCHAFIHQLTTKANIACATAKRKTISPEHIFQGLDAMNLSAYKEHAVIASEEAKEELKGRRMLSASYRFKHHDSEELERLMKEQQEIFLQARAQFVGGQLDRDDLLMASTIAAAASGGGVTYNTGDVDHTLHAGSVNSVEQPMATTTGAGDQPSSVPSLTGSARLLCGGSSVRICPREDVSDDNYDD